MQYDLLPVVAANFPGLRKKRLKLVVGPVGMWKSLAAFWRDFPKQLVGIRAFCGFPQMRHFHQASVFPGSFYPQIPLKTRDSYTRSHRDALKISKVVPFPPYCLRHTALTDLGTLGCDPFTLAKIAGHSSITMTQRYCHPQADAIERTFAGMAERKRVVTEGGQREIPAADNSEILTVSD